MLSGMCWLTSSYVRKPLALPMVMSSRLLRSLSFWDVVPFFVGAPFLATPLRGTRGSPPFRRRRCRIRCRRYRSFLRSFEGSREPLFRLGECHASTHERASLFVRRLAFERRRPVCRAVAISLAERTTRREAEFQLLVSAHLSST